MAKVELRFILPNDPDIKAVHILESASANGPFQEIDSVAAGTYPAYIREFTTLQAQQVSDWFAIQWENTSGLLSDLTAPIKGDTSTLIGEIVDRVLLRSPDLDENLVLQEAEAAVAFVFHIDDPYSVELSSLTRLQINELANLTLVASLYVEASERSTRIMADYTAGMISERNVTDTRNALDSLERLERRALKRLGVGGSLIATITPSPDVLTVTGIKTTFDSSRILSARAIITEHMLVRDLNTSTILSDR